MKIKILKFDEILWEISPSSPSPLKIQPSSHLSRLFNSLLVNNVNGKICRKVDGGKSVVNPEERFPFVQPLEYWKVCPWIWLMHANVVMMKINLIIFYQTFFFCYHSTKIKTWMIENLKSLETFIFAPLHFTSNQSDGNDDFITHVHSYTHI